MKQKGALTGQFTVKAEVSDALSMWNQNDQTLGGMVNPDALAEGMSKLSDNANKSSFRKNM